MPTIFSKGAASAQGFGFGAYSSKPSGTFGIFAIGIICTTNKYTFATCSNSTATSLSDCLQGGSAVGNTTRGIFTIGASRLTRKKYTYSNDVVSSAASASKRNSCGAAAGNGTLGIIALGRDACVVAASNIRNKYTFAVDTSGAATSSSLTLQENTALGNSTRGIFSCGYAGGSPKATRQKYTYACDSSTSATSSTTKAWGGMAVGNSTIGIFALGNTCTACVQTYPDNKVNKYTYSNDTNASTTNLTYKSRNGSATGSTTKGIFAVSVTCAGIIANRVVFTYACSTFSGGASASQAGYGGAAATNGITGVNA